MNHFISFYFIPLNVVLKIFSILLLISNFVHDPTSF